MYEARERERERERVKDGEDIGGRRMGRWKGGEWCCRLIASI